MRPLAAKQRALPTFCNDLSSTPLHIDWIKMPARGKLSPLEYLQTMSLLQLGQIIFGGTPRIIAYLRQHNLLATTMDCTRYRDSYSMKL
jgi:hypothetical protein